MALWTDLGSPRNSYVEALTPKMTVYGDRAHKEVIKKEGDWESRLNDIRVGPWSNKISILKEETWELFLPLPPSVSQPLPSPIPSSPSPPRKGHVSTQQEGRVYKPGRDLSPESK